MHFKMYQVQRRSTINLYWYLLFPLIYWINNIVLLSPPYFLVCAAFFIHCVHGNDKKT